MKGNNTLTLNEATMIEAVQEYLAKRMGATYVPKVTSIKPTTTPSYNAGQLFAVEVTKETPHETPGEPK